MKQYKSKELPIIDDDFKKKWLKFFTDNAIMVALCWECQYVCGDNEKKNDLKFKCGLYVSDDLP